MSLCVSVSEYRIISLRVFWFKEIILTYSAIHTHHPAGEKAKLHFNFAFESKHEFEGFLPLNSTETGAITKEYHKLRRYSRTFSAVFHLSIRVVTSL